MTKFVQYRPKIAAVNDALLKFNIFGLILFLMARLHWRFFAAILSAILRRVKSI